MTTRPDYRNSCLGLAAMLALLVAFHAYAQEPPGQAALLRALFPPVSARPGLGGLPLHAQASVADNVVDLDLLAIIAHPPERVMALLGDVRSWCPFVLLHPNVKACTGELAADRQRVVIYSGAKYFQPVELARAHRYDLSSERREDGILALRLRPETTRLADGPGTVLIEIVALEGGRSGMRLQYREPLSTGARLLATSYFATLGRDKVGFSVTGADAEGKPVYVGGLVGAIERNIVRYFLAIETQLEAAVAALPLERRLAHWFTRTERHALQLHELEWAEYRANKLREFAQSADLQGKIAAPLVD